MLARATREVWLYGPLQYGAPAVYFHSFLLIIERKLKTRYLLEGHRCFLWIILSFWETAQTEPRPQVTFSAPPPKPGRWSLSLLSSPVVYLDHQDSLENKANCFPRDLTLGVYCILDTTKANAENIKANRVMGS